MQPRLRIKTLEYASQSEKSKDLQYDLDGPPRSGPPAIFLLPYLLVPYCFISLSFLVTVSTSFLEHIIHASASEPLL